MNLLVKTINKGIEFKKGNLKGAIYKRYKIE